MSTEQFNPLIDKCQSKSRLSLIKALDNDRSQIARIRPRKEQNSRDHSEDRGD
jgi:hypothetical protein